MKEHKQKIAALAKKWRSLSKEKKAELWRVLDEDTKKLIATTWIFLAREHQLAPDEFVSGDKDKLLMLAGRGFGKTRAGSEWVLDYLKPNERIAIVGSTSGDIRDTMIEGVSGLLACAARRGIECIYEPSKRRVSFPKMFASAACFSAEEPERLRGPQHHRAWLDEMCAWQYPQETWDMLMFGLRLGKSPKALITTTPKPTPTIRAVMEDPRTLVVRGSTFDNKENLSPRFIEEMERRYGGTRLGKQELYGEVLLDNPSALWNEEMIQSTRLDSLPDDIKRIIVAVDPAVTTNESSDETGIIVAAIDYDNHAYIIEDCTVKLGIDKAAHTIVNAYKRHKADRVIAEVNQGGDLVESTFRAVFREIPYRAVRASKGKRLRAEPVSALYEQGRVHHVGHFPELEDQMLTWSPEHKKSPDRLDALVWALTELLIDPRPIPQIHII